MVRIPPNLMFLALALPGSLGFTTPFQTVGHGFINFPKCEVVFRDNRYLTTTNTPMSTPPPPPMASRNQNWRLGMFGGLGNSAASTIPSALLETLFQYHGNVPFLPSFVLNLVLFLLLRTKLLKMLTPQGFAHGVALGTMLWTTLGWRGWSLTVLYLFLGSAVTKIRFSDKEKRGIAESRGGRRGPENLWGSAATGLACAICSKRGASFLGIPSHLFVLAYVASMATKLSDTFASEIGKAFGKTTFLITTLERVEPGTEGAISAEGTGAAMVGGFLLALYGWGVKLIPNLTSVAIVTVSAFLATNVESLLGATLQGKDNLKWITNEMVNFFNTLIGAGFAIAFGFAFL